MLGSVLVTEKAGSEISLFVISRKTAGKVSASSSTPRCARARVAADHPRHLKAEALKGRKLQQEAPHRQIKAPVYCSFKICKYLSVCPRGRLRREGLAARHAPRRHGDAQRVADGFFQNAAYLTLSDGNTVGGEKPPDILAVKEQVVRLQRGHKS